MAYDAQNVVITNWPRMHGGLERGNKILKQMTKPNLLTTKDALVVKNKVAMQWFVNFLRKKDIINLFHLSPR